LMLAALCCTALSAANAQELVPSGASHGDLAVGVVGTPRGVQKMMGYSKSNP